MVEADVARLRVVRDSQTLVISDLEIQIEDLLKELASMKLSHEEVSAFLLQRMYLPAVTCGAS